MKSKFCLGALQCAFFAISRVSLLAQGSLTPSAAPTPTMKSLDQIEPRTPISALPFTISQPGSYYLTKNVSVTTGDAITINTSNVTLDLNGFTISSTQNPAANGTAILLATALKNVTIQNGSISGGVVYSGGTFSGPGFGKGISYVGAAPIAARVSHISVSGCALAGIDAGGSSSEVESCTIDTVGDAGIIAATARSCVVISAGNTGISATDAIDCLASAVGPGHAISAVTATNCAAGANGTGDGINAITASNCYGASNAANGGFGLYAFTANNCYGACANPGKNAINANTVSNSNGVHSGGGRGISANVTTNSQGESVGGNGIYSGYSATNCVGISTSSIGLNTGSAHNCWGKTTTGSAGLAATIANGCVGWQTDSSGDAITAAIAVACGTFGGTITATGGKFLGTP